MNPINVRNLTQQSIRLVNRNGAIVVKPEAPAARADFLPDLLDGNVTLTDGLVLPLFRAQLAPEAFNLPDPEPGTIIIVDRLVAEACRDRDDLFYAHRLLHDLDGYAVGATALARPADAAAWGT